MQNPQSFTIKGKLVYQCETVRPSGRTLVQRAVQQPDGTWWQYLFYRGQGVGTPARGKDRQGNIRAFVGTVKAALAE